MDSSYANDLKKLTTYAASPSLLSHVQWKRGDPGHVLVWKKSQQQFIGTAVVQVFDYRLHCSPSGNFIKHDVGTLDKAKFQFFGGRPADIKFGDDFQNLYANLARLQQDIAVSKRHSDMLFSDASGKMLRFARNIFDKREKTLPDSPPPVYYEDVIRNEIPASDAETIDTETMNWPIDSSLRDTFDIIKPSYRAVPLSVYKDNKFIEPSEVNKVLPNATIEIQFSVHHVYLPNVEPPKDSFRANIEQIIILKSGKRTSQLMKSDPRSGPVPASTRGDKHVIGQDVERAQKRAKTFDEKDVTNTENADKGKDVKGKQKETVTAEEFIEGHSRSTESI